MVQYITFGKDTDTCTSTGTSYPGDDDNDDDDIDDDDGYDDNDDDYFACRRSCGRITSQSLKPWHLLNQRQLLLKLGKIILPNRFITLLLVYV